MIDTVSYTNLSRYPFNLGNKVVPEKDLNVSKNNQTNGVSMEKTEDEKVVKPPNLTRVPKKVLTKEDFIKLFVTQLQYQDPMKPIDNNEMAIQLALFNQVDQLFNINDNLKNIMDLAKDFNLTYASSLIGKEIKVDTNIGRVENGKFLGGEFSIDHPVNKLEVVIRDENNKIVRKLELTDVKKGNHKIEWDAKDSDGKQVPDGNYKFSIVIPGETEVKPLPITMVAKVTGAKLGDKVELVIDENKTIPLDKVEEIMGGE
ncbi:MAG: hypothetical protein GXO57_07210 [Thermodesulfobacteria bacterium]|nr:hypothetical protein [Thermodesulfobacteriota bacterium]